MNEPKIFCVNYPTGYIKVYVNKFFSCSRQTEINKFLKLAMTYCNDNQRIALLQHLEEAKYEQIGLKRKRIERCIEKIKSQIW